MKNILKLLMLAIFNLNASVVTFFNYSTKNIDIAVNPWFSGTHASNEPDKVRNWQSMPITRITTAPVLPGEYLVFPLEMTIEVNIFGQYIFDDFSGVNTIMFEWPISSNSPSSYYNFYNYNFSKKKFNRLSIGIFDDPTCPDNIQLQVK